MPVECVCDWVPGLGTVVQKSHESKRKYRPTRSSVCSFPRTAHSFAGSALLASQARACSPALIHSLAHSVARFRACRSVNHSMSHDAWVLSHRALAGFCSASPTSPASPAFFDFFPSLEKERDRERDKKKETRKKERQKANDIEIRKKQ